MKKLLTAKDKFWIEHVRVQKNSDTRPADYCRKHGLNAKTFSARKSSVLKSSLLDEVQADQVFIPIKKKAATIQISIKLRSGIELTFDHLPEPTWVAKVISQMSSQNDKY